MKELFETISFILFAIFLYSIIFIFNGTPDLWDKLHDKAMESEKCK